METVKVKRNGTESSSDAIRVRSRITEIKSRPVSRKPRGAVQVLVADANRMEVQLLASALKRCRHHFAIVGHAVDSNQVRNLLQEHPADIVLIGANLQDGAQSGFKVIRELRMSHPQTRAIMLLDSCDRDIVIEAFRSGAKGVFCRAEPVEALCKCIHRVHAGQVWANTNEMQYILEALALAAPLRVVNANGVTLLTRREEQVVRLVAEGMTNREISQQLTLSEHTIKNYLFRIFEKLGISSRVELTLYVLNQRQPGMALAQ